MIGRNFACLFHLNFGSGRHFAGLDDDDEHFYAKSLLVIPAENQTLNKSYAGVGGPH